MIGIKPDLKRLRKAMISVKDATRKTEAEICTRTARNVAFRAAQFTPFTTAAKIEQEMRRDNLLPKLASRNLKQKQGRFTREEHRKEMMRIKGKRKSGTRALRAGWAKAIMDLGGSFRGAKMKPGGSASEGFGKKATPTRLIAKIRNAITTSDAFGRLKGAADIPELVKALNRAIDFVSDDMEKYAIRKLTQAVQKAKK